MAKLGMAATSTAVTVIAAGLAYAASKMLSPHKQPQLARSIPSPRSTLLHHLSKRQAAALPYPPDLFPGARDVDTLYGSMRVYEWGPEDGRKVVMLPGDTSPAPVFGHIATALVSKGFRVMLIGTFTSSTFASC